MAEELLAKGCLLASNERSKGWLIISSDPTQTHTFRKCNKILGGSDVGKVLAMRTLVARERHFARGEFMNDAMMLGKLCEPLVAQSVVQRFDLKPDEYEYNPCIFIKDCEKFVLVASPDLIISGPKQESQGWSVIEIKTVCKGGPRLTVEEIPVAHLFQLIHYGECEWQRELTPQSPRSTSNGVNW